MWDQQIFELKLQIDEYSLFMQEYYSDQVWFSIHFPFPECLCMKNNVGTLFSDIFVISYQKLCSSLKQLSLKYNSFRAHTFLFSGLLFPIESYAVGPEKKSLIEMVHLSIHRVLLIENIIFSSEL